MLILCGSLILLFSCFTIDSQVEVLSMEKNESSMSRRSFPGKGPGTSLFENRPSSTGLASQLSNISSQRSVDSVAKQNLASVIEHGSGRKSLSECALVDPNPASGNVSLRKQFHSDEEYSTSIKIAKGSEDESLFSQVNC